MGLKISGISGVLTIVLVAGLLLHLGLASSGTASWSYRGYSRSTGNVLVPDGVDVRDVAPAASGMTIYAVPGDSGAGNVVYKSIDGGVT